MSEELQRALFVDTVEGVSQSVVVESAGVHPGSEKQFGVLLRNEMAEYFQREVEEAVRREFEELLGVGGV